MIWMTMVMDYDVEIVDDECGNYGLWIWKLCIVKIIMIMDYGQWMIMNYE